MNKYESIVSIMEQADSPDPVQDETTGGTDETLESQTPVEEEGYELEAEQDGEVAEDDGYDDESDPDDYYTVKVGGEELQVTLDEALKGYQRDADYRKKTMTLSEERKALEAEKAKLSELVTGVDSFIKRETEDVDWEALRDEDPTEFIRRKEELDKAKSLRDRAIKKQQEDYQKLVNENSSKLLQEMGGDEWTQEQRNTDMQLVSEYLKENGFKDEEMSQIIDYRMWKVLINAAKADKYKKTERKVKESVRKAPKSVKPGRQMQPNERKRQAALDKINKSGRGRAGVDALADFLNL